MKLLNYVDNGKIKLAIKTEQGIIDVERSAQIHSLDVPVTMDEVISRGEVGSHILDKLLGQELNFIPEEDITFAPSVIHPEKILCVGLNYESHRKETKHEIPAYPVVFSKFQNAIAAHQQSITLPAVAEQVDHEAELVIVIGKEAKNVSKEEALSYVFGYTIGNDISARDLQYRTSQWMIGKTCDNFAPIGPYLVTADEIDPQNLNISCTVNGTLRQSANTSEMVFDCATIVSYLSSIITLKPGDIIFTGTPSGVIMEAPKEQQVWLKPGDEVTVIIEKIGSLSNLFE